VGYIIGILLFGLLVYGFITGFSDGRDEYQEWIKEEFPEEDKDKE
jgi:hypothetical protein